jgi:hypothetical protein
LYVPVAGYQETRIEWTRSKAIVAAGKSAVCWITGHLCAMDITWLKPMPAAARPARATPLLLGADALRLILHVYPLMANYRLAVHCVAGCSLNPQAPQLPVLFLHVLERELYFGSVLQAESIQQGSDVFGRHHALDMIFRLCEHPEIGRELVGRFEPPEFGRHRRRRWW